MKPALGADEVEAQQAKAELEKARREKARAHDEAEQRTEFPLLPLLEIFPIGNFLYATGRVVGAGDSLVA
jgi:hypothetical protein